ncbi:MAG: LysR family transcriptional regulator [Sandaracinus sp.]
MSNIDDVALDVPLLRLFDALLAEGHVTRAAQRLRLTQSAASHGLARLRRSLGDPLFVRGPRGVVPTDRARAIGPEVRRLLDGVEALARPAGPFDPKTLARTFVLGGADYMEILLLPELLRRIAREAPEVDLASRPIAADPEAGLESGTLDLAIGVFPKPAPRLVARKLFEERFVCMLRRGHPALKEPLTIERFAALPHVLISPRGSGGGVVDEALAAHRLKRRIAVRTSTFLAAPLIASQSDCVVTLPARIAAVMSRGRKVVLVPPPLRVPGFTVGMLFHERSRADLAHAWLRAHVAAAAEALGKAS